MAPNETEYDSDPDRPFEAHMIRRDFYTPAEVARHSDPSDCWVSLLGRVYDLTFLIRDNAGNLDRPILEMAGKDISHWFDPETGDIRYHIEPTSLVRTPYTPQGRFIHIPPDFPCSKWATDFGEPWWKGDKYYIGRLSRKVRHLRIVNTLTHDEHTVDVCAEEKLANVRARYLDFNAHAKSYSWKRLGEELDMEKTLAENGIIDESEDFYELNLDEDFYIPAVHIYFNDDLTVA
eukprot:TRINITY_DN9961_c0_g1_i1.p1 TRINITY_DN9961_c0_g1~~TRINITY_DN9961_c0_g1_i1.p1  ORF type:complete len:234 (+),score=32.41 TRINITY_DN9961_c0_g1_i1:81-782(+)